MKNLKVLACLVALLVVLIVCAPTAQATEISGTITKTLTIYEDSELVDDVTCTVMEPPGNPCIKFGASDITLKLNGFTINGPATPPDGCTKTFSPDDGIAVVEQHDVAILGPGLVQKFGRHGIFLGNSMRVKVKGVTASDNCFSGILLGGTTDSDIEKNISVRNAIGSQNFPCGGT
jgi:hypothetical protein